MFDHIKALFLDLDGTLNNISDKTFMRVYVPQAYQHFTDCADFPTFSKHLLAGTEAMIHNQSNAPVVNAFFRYFSEKMLISEEDAIQRFIHFYQTNFDVLQKVTNPIPYGREVVDLATQKGWKLVLATQPLFYELATTKRVIWSNLDPSSFNLITHALNSKRCKPYPEYFLDLLHQLNLQPEEALMVGNDFFMDMAARHIGMKTWMVDTLQTNIEHASKNPPHREGSLKDLYVTLDGKVNR